MFFLFYEGWTHRNRDAVKQQRGDGLQQKFPFKNRIYGVLAEKE
jgi:hypothetical protein